MGTQFSPRSHPQYAQIRHNIRFVEPSDCLCPNSGSKYACFMLVRLLNLGAILNGRGTKDDRGDKYEAKGPEVEAGSV